MVLSYLPCPACHDKKGKKKYIIKIITIITKRILRRRSLFMRFESIKV
jgi:hypothetical protein